MSESRARRSGKSRPRFAAFDFWLGPADALRMRVFECLFTATFLIWMGRCFLTWREWLTDEGFHLTGKELSSIGYPEPWPLLEPWQVIVFALAIAVSAALILLNRWRRVGLIAIFFCALYAQRVDFMAAFTLNKLYVGIFAILALAPAMRRDPKSGGPVQSAAPLRVLQATLILQYLAAGLAKAEGDWLSGGDILWSQVQGVYRSELAAWALRTFPMWLWAALQFLSLGFELLAPVLFTVRRLRPVAFLMGMGFHLMIALMMKDLIYFSLQMGTFYALFVTSDEWRAIGNRLGRRLPEALTAF